MDTKHLVDPEMFPLLDNFPQFTLTLDNVQDIRQYLIDNAPPLPEPALIPEIIYAPGRDGAPDIPLFIYRSQNKSQKHRPAIIHFHGGGMMFGSAKNSQERQAQLALDLDLIVISVEYRLSPETPFPGPQEDGYAALAWVNEHAETLGIDSTRILVMGESAGGGLAAALAHMVRDRGEYRLAGQLLIYPMLDYRTGSGQCRWNNPNTGEFIWTRSHNQIGWQSLRGSYRADDQRVAWFSPALAENMAGLPPTFIAVGGIDLFVDENLDYARRLNTAGIPTTFHLYPGVPHAFNLINDARTSRQFNADLKQALQRFADIA
jgi:triacylglycerol lipase